jgi:hypothetical protein
MKSYQIDNNIVKLPETLSEVSVKQLIEIHDLGELTGSVNDVIRLINVFSEAPVDLNTVDLGSILEISVQLSAVLFENRQIEPIDKFVLDGEEYLCQAPEDLSVKYFIDFQEVSKEPVRNLPLILALVYRTKAEVEPNDEEYQTYIMAKKAKFMELDAKTAQGCLLFFSNLFSDYVINTLESLEMTEEQRKIVNQTIKKMKAQMA